MRSLASGESAFSALSYCPARKLSRPRCRSRLCRSSMGRAVLGGVAVALADELQEQLGALGLVGVGVAADDLLEVLLGLLGVPHLQVRLAQRQQQLGLAPRLRIVLER